MPLTGDYEPSTSDWARENAEKYMESGGTKGTELKGRPVILLTTIGAKTRKDPQDPADAGRTRRRVRDRRVARRRSEEPRLVLQRQGEPPGRTAGRHRRRGLRGSRGVRRREGAWWERAVAAWPDYADYQKKTDRQIPVFVLTPGELNPFWREKPTWHH